MKKGIVFLITLVVLAIAGNHQALAQSNPNQSNGTFEMLDVYAPDFIAFKVAEGKTFEKMKVAVYLVSDTKSFEAGKVTARGVSIKVADGGAWETTYTDETVFHVMNFNIPGTTIFEAQKIKIVADGKTMYYDIANAQWESDSGEKSGKR